MPRHQHMPVLTGSFFLFSNSIINNESTNLTLMPAYKTKRGSFLEIDKHGNIYEYNDDMMRVLHFETDVKIIVRPPEAVYDEEEED
jgi:predicted glycosyltransferase